VCSAQACKYTAVRNVFYHDYEGVPKMKSNKMNGLFFVHLHLYLSEQLLQKNQNRIHGRNFVNKVKY